MREGKGREGKGRKGKGREGKGREGKGREGKGREGKGREGKGREGKGREGKGREGEAPMAVYRALQDLSVPAFISAGTLFFSRWSNHRTRRCAAGATGMGARTAVDCVDSDAIQKFWNAGVQLLGLVRQQFTGVPVAPPQIYWQPFPSAGGTRPYQLTGAGAALGPVNWTNTRGANP